MKKIYFLMFFSLTMLTVKNTYTRSNNQNSDSDWSSPRSNSSYSGLSNSSDSNFGSPRSASPDLAFKEPTLVEPQIKNPMGNLNLSRDAACGSIVFLALISLPAVRKNITDYPNATAVVGGLFSWGTCQSLIAAASTAAELKAVAALAKTFNSSPDQEIVTQIERNKD